MTARFPGLTKFVKYDARYCQNKDRASNCHLTFGKTEETIRVESNDLQKDSRNSSFEIQGKAKCLSDMRDKNHLEKF